MEDEQQAAPVTDLDMGNMLAPDNFTVDNKEQESQNNKQDDPLEHQEDTVTDTAPQEQPDEQDLETEQQSQDADVKDAESKESDYYEITTSDGATQKVTIDDLKKGYLMQSDYTKKTTDLAAERAKMQESYTQLETQFLNAAKTLLQKYNPVSNLQAQREAIIKEALEAREIGDDLGFTSKRLDLQELDKQIERMENEINTIFQADNHQTKQLTQQQLNAEREKLFSALPELQQPEKAKEFQEATYKALSKVGYTEQDMVNMAQNVDAKQAHLAYLAGMYLNMQSQASNVAKNVQDKIVSPKPKAGRQGNPSSLLDKLKQDPNNERAIGALLAPS